MFDETNDDTQEDRAQAALRAGLSDLPTPELSAYFDAGIQAALLKSPSRISSGFVSYLQFLWTACRPAVPAAAMTLCATLLLVHLVQQSPVGLPVPANGSVGVYEHPGSRGQGGSDGDALDNMNLTDASLRLFSRPTHGDRNRSG